MILLSLSYLLNPGQIQGPSWGDHSVGLSLDVFQLGPGFGALRALPIPTLPYQWPVQDRPGEWIRNHWTKACWGSFFCLCPGKFRDFWKSSSMEMEKYGNPSRQLLTKLPFASDSLRLELVFLNFVWQHFFFVATASKRHVQLMTMKSTLSLTSTPWTP